MHINDGDGKFSSSSPRTVFFTSSPLLILEKEWEKGEAENSEPSGQKRGKSVPNVLVVAAALRKSK